MVLRAALAMGDAWGTPMQVLIRTRTPCDLPALAYLGEFLQRTAHNDSVNLMPSRAELLRTSLLGRWTITASRLLGIAGWRLVLMLLVAARLVTAAPAPGRAIVLLGLLALGTYLALFKWTHAVAMQAGAPVNLAQSLLLFFKFSTWPLQQALTALSQPELILVACSSLGLPGPQALRCLKSSSEITPATVERYGVTAEYLQWQKRPDPACRAAYARGLNSVLWGR